MAVFENPNSPQQPHKGIYVWYATKGNSKITIYVGRAGFQETCLPRGTLFRGISELQRCTFTSNSPDYNILDTDFIVGTAIRYFEDKRGYQCYWKHINGDPSNERKFVLEENPILQDNDATIKDKFKIKRAGGRWRLTPEMVVEAENKLFQQLAEL